MNFNRSKGFTLIELMIVIAIIVILAAVIFASLSKSKSKAKATRVLSELSSIRNQAEIYYRTSGNDSYGNVLPVAACSTAATSMFGTQDSNVSRLVADLISIADTGNVFCAAGSTADVASAASSWAISVEDPSSLAIADKSSLLAALAVPLRKFFCIDSSGVSATLNKSYQIDTITRDTTSARCNLN